jgi:hypothetical protein
MAPEHRPLLTTIENQDPGHRGPRSHATSAGMDAAAAANQKPGAEFRPGSILQLQFPE